MSELEDLNLINFDTQNVNDMSFMFEHCNKLKNLDLSSFNTKNVKNMKSMFKECEKLKELDLSSFDFQNVTEFYNIFLFCEFKELKINQISYEKIKLICKENYYSFKITAI